MADRLDMLVRDRHALADAHIVRDAVDQPPGLDIKRFGGSGGGGERRRRDQSDALKVSHCFGSPEIGRAPSELQSLMRISYAVFCLKKKNISTIYTTNSLDTLA